MTRYEDCSNPRAKSAKSACAKPKAKSAKSACAKPKAKSTCSKPKAKSTCSKPRGKCSKPGPVTNNGYLNFLRSFRRRNCGLQPRELISKAAHAWNCLPENKKDFYRRMACKVSTSARHKRRRVCQNKKQKQKQKQCH